jgi:hypothetical protein
MTDEVSAAAIATLRRRAERQRKIAANWTTVGANGVEIRSGEAVVALRIADALEAAAEDIEQEAGL